MNKEDREKEEQLKGEVLYDLLFNKKVDKLGNLTVEQRDGFVVVDSGGKKDIISSYQSNKKLTITVHE
jgi:hypothetical protein